MKYRAYDIELTNPNQSLEAIGTELEGWMGRMSEILSSMNWERIQRYTTVNLFVERIERIDGDTLFAQVYKVTDHTKAVHVLEQLETGETAMKEVISEGQSAFERGSLGFKAIDGRIICLIEHGFGSYFSQSATGLLIEPRFSSEPYEIIRKSPTLGRTLLRINPESEIFSSWRDRSPTEYIKEDHGFGNLNLFTAIEDILRLYKISKTHELSVQIDRTEWIDNVDTFQKISESEFVESIRVQNTIEGTVTITDKEKSIRETVGVRKDTPEEEILDAFDSLT
jgi:hypothetical protein